MDNHRASNTKSIHGKRRRNKREDIKVVYISSPIKVKTSASEFRALVQELTGKDSDIADSHFGDHLHDCQRGFVGDYLPAATKGSGENGGESPSSSDHQNAQMEDSFVEAMLSSVLFSEYTSGYGINA